MMGVEHGKVHFRKRKMVLNETTEEVVENPTSPSPKDTSIYSKQCPGRVLRPQHVGRLTLHSTASADHQIRVSSRRSLLPSSPMHALRNVSSALRWRESELTTSVPAPTTQSDTKQK